MTRRLRLGEGGSAIVEFIFVAILVLMPLLYLIVAVASVQRGRLTVSAAARDVGRVLSTARSADEAQDRFAAALRVALANGGLSPADVEVRYVAATASCDGAAVTPVEAPGEVFAVCVIRRQVLPAIPQVLSGRGVRLVGRYVVHVDDFAVVQR